MPRKDNPERKYTAIRVSKETRDKLNSFKIIPQEPVKSVIKRLIEFYEDNNKKDDIK